MEFAKLSITNNSTISAIYYALLQCGYDFYPIERDALTIKKLQSFIMPANNISDIERNQMFWDWIHQFPRAINHVLQSNGFGRYLEWENETFIFCSGALREESVIHEFIHHVVHPVVERRKDEILRHNFVNLGVDASYYLNGNEAGRLNAFEEYMVRKLTDKILGGDIPENLDALFHWEEMAYNP